MFIPPEAMIKMLLGENKKRFCPNCGVRMHIDLYNHVLFCPKCYYEEILWKGAGGAHGVKIRTGMTTWHNQNQIIVEIVGINWGERMKLEKLEDLELLWENKKLFIKMLIVIFLVCFGSFTILFNIEHLENMLKLKILIGLASILIGIKITLEERIRWSIKKFYGFQKGYWYLGISMRIMRKNQYT